MGFMVDTQGSLWDPFMQERALEAYARLLERQPDDADLRSRRARLLEARADFPAAAREWELADTVAQRLVTAETALDLGRHDLGRRLVGEARALIGARIGEQVRRTGGVAPGLMRRQASSEDAARAPEGDS